MESNKKCKPAMTSVPSISIRFNANAQELAVETTQPDEVSDQDEQSNNRTPKLGQRSSSVDATDPPWRLFSKLSKTVEEKFRHNKGNKEGSSLSASEEDEESSLSKTYGVTSTTTEGVESTTSEDEADIDSDAAEAARSKRVVKVDDDESLVESGVEVLEDAQPETKPGFVDLRVKTGDARGFNYYRAGRWLVVVIALFMYGLAPLPVYVSGFLSGAVVVMTLWWILGGSVPLPMSVVEVAAAEEYQPVRKTEGWMNELPEEYDPATYHISKTQSVLVRLHGDKLRLSHTRQKIAKRAIWNEMKSPHINFTNHRLYDLRGSTVALLPVGLAKKRHWSKKYPICVTLQQAGLPSTSGGNILSKSDDEEESDMEDVGATSWHLYLFARTDREKEDWYRRLLKATGNEDTKVDMVDYGRLSRVSGDQLWIDALVSRLIFSAIRDDSFKVLIQDKIQKKLQTLRLPYFIEELVVSDLNFGSQVPKINVVASPVWDERGLWLDLDFDYLGLVTVLLETKLNLMKLKQSGLVTKLPQMDESRRSAMFDSDLEDSAESSSDCESQTHTDSEPSGTKFLKMVDRLAANKYFQQATDLVYVKKAMEGVSRTEIKLKVELRSLSGTLVLNLPPWPSDRLWLGFRPVPKVQLQALPAVGERSISFQHVTGWIENKLLAEFQKLLVVPNMEDFIVPFKSGL